MIKKKVVDCSINLKLNMSRSLSIVTTKRYSIFPAKYKIIDSEQALRADPAIPEPWIIVDTFNISNYESFKKDLPAVLDSFKVKGTDWYCFKNTQCLKSIINIITGRFVIKMKQKPALKNKKTKKKPSKKNDDFPPKPLNSYMLYMREQRRLAGRILDSAAFSKICGKRWNSLDQSKKKIYIDQAKLLMDEYKASIRELELKKHGITAEY